MDTQDRPDGSQDEQPTQPLETPKDLSGFTLRLTEELYEALVLMTARAIVIRPTCPRCGGPARGSFYANEADRKATWTHEHPMIVGCLACAFDWCVIVTHGGHGELTIHTP